MATAVSKVNLAQTATHAAAVMTAAAIQAGNVNGEALDEFRVMRDAIIQDLEAFKDVEVQEKVANFGESIVNERYRKHAGKTWNQVLSEDPGYVHWLATKTTGDKDDVAAAAAFLRSKGVEPKKPEGRNN